MEQPRETVPFAEIQFKDIQSLDRIVRFLVVPHERPDFKLKSGLFVFPYCSRRQKESGATGIPPPQGNSPEQYPGQRTSDNGSDTDHRQTGVGKHRRQKVLDELARTNVAGRQADKQAKTNAAGRQAGQRVAGEYRDKSPEANRQRRSAGRFEQATMNACRGAAA